MKNENGADDLDQLDILDERWVTEVLEAITDNRISLVVHGVHSIESPNAVLYGECLTHLVSKTGKNYSTGHFRPLLDIWEKTSLLDRHVLRMALDELEANPHAVRGCNTSADSVVNSGEWTKTKGVLLERSSLLPRLILEIKEPHFLGDMVTAKRWLEEARELGCRIAIDDFGSGHAAPIQLLALDVDIIKIDVLFAHHIRASRIRGNSLIHMVGLAACSAPVIVVEGVETEEQLQMAYQAGATHVHGYHLSRPMERPSLKEGRFAAS
ncbi:EAL domain-containing protein [Brucella intermedia]|uniref:EAL domain-containing protein n=1 Tax=Brucella intermedia TaxID=94625 RepID=UPI00124E5916|nr:EAL domain-containing protein [Brucella intermedia]KAB2715327.1 EAL domain-containing protein [Brucella intermedia]